MESKNRPNSNCVFKNHPISVIQVVIHAENAKYMIKNAFCTELLTFATPVGFWGRVGSCKRCCTLNLPVKVESRERRFKNVFELGLVSFV